MRVFIPEIGTRLVLSRPWGVLIHDETRNSSIYEAAKLALSDAELARLEAEVRAASAVADEAYRARPWGTDARARYGAARNGLMRASAVPITLPAGTELIVDRIYIRKGLAEYSSVTFTMTRTDHPQIGGIRGKKRFWARLADVNTMEVEDQAV